MVYCVFFIKKETQQSVLIIKGSVYGISVDCVNKDFGILKVKNWGSVSNSISKWKTMLVHYAYYSHALHVFFYFE